MSKQIRKIPKKTYLLILIVTLFIIFGFYLTVIGKNEKARKVLVLLGYKDIKNLKTYSKKVVENIDTKQRGFKFFVEFDYKDKHCKGFIFRSYKNKVNKDLECK